MSLSVPTRRSAELLSGWKRPLRGGCPPRFGIPPGNEAAGARFLFHPRCSVPKPETEGPATRTQTRKAWTSRKAAKAGHEARLDEASRRLDAAREMRRVTTLQAGFLAACGRSRAARRPPLLRRHRLWSADALEEADHVVCVLLLDLQDVFHQPARGR